MMYGWHDGGWGIFWMILSWVVIVAIVALLVRVFAGGGRPLRKAGAMRRQILDDRFAQGEISEEEYRDRNACPGREPALTPHPRRAPVLKGSCLAPPSCCDAF